MATSQRGTAATPSVDGSHRLDFLSLADEREPGEVVSDFASEIDDALARASNDALDVAWIQGQSCTGCTVSLLQGEYADSELELEQFRKSIGFHPTLMNDTGEKALDAIGPAPDVLIVEGSIPTRIPRAATLGVDRFGNRRPIMDWVIELAECADVVIAAGSCAAFGGLPAAGEHDPTVDGGSPTGAVGVQFDGTDPGGVVGPDYQSGTDLPVINIPGCPAHPDHVILTVASVLNGHQPRLDEYNRPLPLFEPLIHDDCELREDYECNNFAPGPGEDGCLYDAGCAGVHARCDDSKRLRNGGTSICRDVGAPCIGCVEPAFWDRFSPFYDIRETKETEEGTAIDRLGGSSPRPTSNVAGLLVMLPVLVLLAPLAPVLFAYWLFDRHFGSEEPISWGSDTRGGH